MRLMWVCGWEGGNRNSPTGVFGISERPSRRRLNEYTIVQLYHFTVDACHKETLKIVFLTHRNDFAAAPCGASSKPSEFRRGERRQQRQLNNDGRSPPQPHASRAGLSSLQLCLQPMMQIWIRAHLTSSADSLDSKLVNPHRCAVLTERLR